jgi:hypothetical protein
MTEEQWSLINARISAVEELALAIARTSPHFEQIRERFIAIAEARRKALHVSPMVEDRIEALMHSFEHLHAELDLPYVAGAVFQDCVEC